MIHFILLHDRVCGKHTVANSNVQVASGLHPLRTCHFSLQSLLTPLDAFVYLFKIVSMEIFFPLNINENANKKVYLPSLIARNTASPPIDRALLSAAIVWRLPSRLYMRAYIFPYLSGITRTASIYALLRERISLLFRKTVIKH
jgi:hypothetical protein